MESPKFVCGAKVFAKVKGYPPWPAIVDAVEDENPQKIRYNVYFYGTKEVATCNEKDLCSYIDNRNTLGKFKKLNKQFNDSIVELDSELGFVPFSQKREESNVMQTTSISSLLEINYSKCGTQKINNSKCCAQKTGLGLHHTSQEIVVASDFRSSSKGRSRSKDQRRSNGLKKSVSQGLRTRSRSNSATRSVSERKYNSPWTKVAISRSKSMGKLNLVLDQGICLPGGNKEIHAKLGPRSETRAQSNKGSNSQRPNVEEQLPKHPKPFANNSDYDKSDKLLGQKLLFLKIEARLLNIELGIQSSLTLKHANPDTCLKLLNELEVLKIKSLMLKKHPEIVDTLNKLQNYTGNTMEWNISNKDLTNFGYKARQIRTKSEIIYYKIQSLFAVPYKKTFLELFDEEVKRFKDSTKTMSLYEYLELTEDPSINHN